MIQQFHSEYIPRRIESRDLNRCFVHLFIVVVFTIARRWRQPKYPSTGKWINRMYTLWTFKKVIIQPYKRKCWHAMTQMSLEDVVLREISE